MLCVTATCLLAYSIHKSLSDLIDRAGIGKWGTRLCLTIVMKAANYTGLSLEHDRGGSMGSSSHDDKSGIEDELIILPYSAPRGLPLSVPRVRGGVDARAASVALAWQRLAVLGTMHEGIIDSALGNREHPAGGGGHA